MDKKVLVAGAGISGMNACRLLLAKEQQVILYDGNAAKDPEELKASLGNAEGLEILLGELTAEDLAGVSLCVISPGISLEVPFVETIRQAGIPIWSEIELAYHYAKGDLIAITGTNGKTTTTALVGKICEDYNPSTFVVGNIGNAYTKEALKTTDESITVAEVSSFQLETIVDFHPRVSAVLNITPDHLNRHKTMENYAAVKVNVAANQTAEDVCILNYEDERLRELAKNMVPKVLYFSSAREVEEGAYLDGEDIILRLNGQLTKVCNIHDLNLLGRHNYENVMAAVLMTVSIGIPMDSIRKSLGEFQAVEHRIEFVAEKQGVTYYNDSKGTNPDAAIQAIRAMVRPALLIGGGYDKGGEFDDWIEACVGRVKLLILMGATAERIGKTAEKYGITDIVYVNSMEEAVALAAEKSVPGDAVLLSPACASWGMFPNYEERGRIFKELVHKL